MTLRICHLGKFYPPAPGGIEVHVQALARAQARLGADVRVVCVNHRDVRRADVTWRSLGSTPTVEEDDEGVRVVRLGRHASLSKLDVCPSLPGTLWKLREEGVDVVHVHAPNPTMFIALAAMPAFASLVVTHHSDVVAQKVLGRAFAPLERIVHERADLVLSTSEAYVAGSSVLRRLGAKVRALPLGLDLAPFLEPNAAVLAHETRLRGECAGEPLWLAVGRLVYYKGFETAIDALAHVPGRLLVVGTGPLEHELRARASQRGVADRVRWIGYAEPDVLQAAYRAATALWFPGSARSEGYGLAQVEAMASGCPVINTAIPHSGVPWVSRHEETGLTVQVGDSAAMAVASRRLLHDPGLRARLAAGAVRRARSEFDASVMGKRSFELYARATGGRGAPSTDAAGSRRVSTEVSAS
jgi:rhamnosyl/mannosyltransferase